MVAWLIRRERNGFPEYVRLIHGSEIGMVSWTPDRSGAFRMATQADAEAFIRWSGCIGAPYAADLP